MYCDVFCIVSPALQHRSSVIETLNSVKAVSVKLLLASHPRWEHNKSICFQLICLHKVLHSSKFLKPLLSRPHVFADRS